MSELLPCPFCGGAAETCTDFTSTWIACEDCDSEATPSMSVETAKAYWNRRAPRKITHVERAPFVYEDDTPTPPEGAAP